MQKMINDTGTGGQSDHIGFFMNEHLDCLTIIQQCLLQKFHTVNSLGKLLHYGINRVPEHYFLLVTALLLILENFLSQLFANPGLANKRHPRLAPALVIGSQARVAMK